MSIGGAGAMMNALMTGINNPVMKKRLLIKIKVSPTKPEQVGCGG
jgi:hypothetical protein